MSIQKFHKAAMLEENGESTDRAPTGEVFEAYDELVPSMVCAGCSCLCDDISVYVRNGRVVRTLNLCEVGALRLSSLSGADRAAPLSPAAYRETIERAAAVLRSHRPTLVLGTEVLDEAALRGSWELAEHLRGLWLPWAFPALRGFYERAAAFGWDTALLDEVRDQADLVMFWRADPLVTHHRHLSRYSLFARGRSTERGNHDRNLAVIASDRTTIEPLCQQFFQLSPAQEKAFAHALVDPGQGPAFDHRDFSLLVRALERASCVALFLDPGEVSGDIQDLLFAWSRKVNAGGRQRVVMLPLWNAGSNIEGFCQLCLEKSAGAWGADFTTGSPEPVGRNVDWETLGRKAESVLLLGSPAGCTYATELPGSLGEKPRVLIDPFRSEAAPAADVVLPAALPGIEHGGVFARADGLPLEASALEGLADRGYPPAEQLFLELIREVG